GALPGHPSGKGFNFVESNIGMIANTALARPARAVVLHAKTFKHANGTIVHFHWKGQRQGAARAPQDLAQTGFEAAFLGGIIELAHGDSKRVEIFFGCNGRGVNRKPGSSHKISFRPNVLKPRRRAPYPAVATLRHRSSRYADVRIRDTRTRCTKPRS